MSKKYYLICHGCDATVEYQGKGRPGPRYLPETWGAIHFKTKLPSDCAHPLCGRCFNIMNQAIHKMLESKAIVRLTQFEIELPVQDPKEVN